MMYLQENELKDFGELAKDHDAAVQILTICRIK